MCPDCKCREDDVMNDLDFFYEYIREFQESDIPKEELKSQYVRYWMIESMQEDVIVQNLKNLI